MCPFGSRGRQSLSSFFFLSSLKCGAFSESQATSGQGFKLNEYVLVWHTFTIVSEIKNWSSRQNCFSLNYGRCPLYLNLDLCVNKPYSIIIWSLNRSQWQLFLKKFAYERRHVYIRECIDWIMHPWCKDGCIFYTLLWNQKAFSSTFDLKLKIIIIKYYFVILNL